ncbi:MAG: FecR family protein [Chitinophagaceae bacterium]|nr:FecR family protein [Chitinophagaceae bacterium]
MSNQKVLALLQKYLDGKATFEEKALIDKWYSLLENIEDDITVGDQTTLKEKLYQQIVAELNKKEAIVVPFYKRSFFRVAASVAILLLVSIGAFLIYNNKNKHTEVAKVEKTNSLNSDVVPGGNKAILTLADGSTIILDNAANGNLTEQGNTKVIKLDDGQLAYNTLNEKPTEIVYNTISTPRGGQYQLTLADGTKVWLNAASTLRFPATFSGNERKVELTGEGYFEVAKNAAMPFKVSVNNMTVEVLGTHFNINSYSDEASIKTTLLEGAVKVTNGDAVQMLSPSNQAQLTADGEIRLNRNVDIEDVVAWKNGIFNFSGTAIENIMRQISRWYDLDVSYEGAISKETFSGVVSRNSNLSQVLKIMEQAGVKFKIEGKKIIVMY